MDLFAKNPLTDERELDYFNISTIANLRTKQADFDYFGEVNRGDLSKKEKVVFDKIGELYAKKPEKVKQLLREHSGLTFPTSNAKAIDATFDVAPRNKKFLKKLTGLLVKHTDIQKKLGGNFDYAFGEAIGGLAETIGSTVTGISESKAKQQQAKEETTQKMLELNLQKMKGQRMIVYIVIAMIIVAGIVAGVIIYNRRK